MADDDILNKTLDILDKREDEGMPDECEAIVKDVESTNREAIFGSGGKYGKPTDPYVQIHFAVMYGGAELETGKVAYQITTGVRSKLAKYNKRYGRPEVGQEIVVFLPKDNDYWDIDLKPV